LRLRSQRRSRSLSRFCGMDSGAERAPPERTTEDTMTRKPVRIGEHCVGDDQRGFIVAEIGINHNGALQLAQKRNYAAVHGRGDAVKFQKRTPALCVPRDQWHVQRDTPWGRLSYIDYRQRIELGDWEYAEIDRYCRRLGILWFASCWDEAAVDFIEQFSPCCYK